MKKLSFILLILSLSLPSFAGTLTASCGEIKKVKEKTKNIFPFPLSILGTRTMALKVKLLNAKDHTASYMGLISKSSETKTIKLKLAYTDIQNYNKHLNLLKDAVYEKSKNEMPVYVCFGKVVGIERWHTVASSSTRSTDEAMEELVRKYL